MRTFAPAAVLVMAATGCASPLLAPEPMPLCGETDASRAVEPGLLRYARAEAQRYSNETYGEDCYVCAEVLDPSDDDGLLWIHITNPIPDALINTSAAIWVRPADGKVVRKGKWHSCHARILRRGSPAATSP